MGAADVRARRKGARRRGRESCIVVGGWERGVDGEEALVWWVYS